jgi:hypothetical protein
MDPSLEDPSSLTTDEPPSSPDQRRRRTRKSMRIKRLNKSRPKKTDEENHDVQTAGIKR